VTSPLTGFMSQSETTSKVTIPAGAILGYLPRASETLLGMSQVVWRGRKYSVFDRDLQERCERTDIPNHT
jgi:hypothetical protein